MDFKCTKRIDDYAEQRGENSYKCEFEKPTIEHKMCPECQRVL